MDVIAYIRVSTSEQGNSLITQEEAISRWAQSMGHNLIHTYRDEGVSGSIKPMMRPGGSEAIRHAKEVGGLVVFKLDRISRSVRHILELIDEGLGTASLISISESFDANTPSGRMFTTMLASMAEWEKARLVERITDGFATCRRLGKKMGGPVPFGYTVSPDHRLIPIEDEQKVFILAKRFRSKGWSWQEISDELNRRGLRRREDREWNAHVLWRMMRSEERRKAT